MNDPSKKEKKTLPEKKRRKYLRILWALVVAPFLLVFLLVFVVSLEWFGSLPKVEDLLNPRMNLATEILSADGKILGKYYAENRVNVKYRDLSPYLINALIATEDARFHGHSGIDFRGLVRVLGRTVIGGDQGGGGGSTISQQLAKMLFPRQKKMSKVKMVIQKVKEWIIASRLEKLYTKDEILTMYLNKFDFVNLAVGIKSASKIYFNTTPDSLRLEQAAMLVGMAKNPSLFNPNNPRRVDTTTHRRNVVMFQMKEYGYLAKAKYDSLKMLPLGINFQQEDHNLGLAPYLREFLRDNFMEKWCAANPKPDGTQYDVYRDGLKIYTTIDSRMQGYAEQAMEQHMKELQGKFSKECKQKKNAPFDWRLTKEEVRSIMASSMKRSERYRVLKEQGLSASEIEKNFNTPIAMKVFSWKGDFDTIMSPMDSMRYYKTFLRSGFMSMDPHTGYIKAWVGGINYKHFKYDQVKTARRQVGSTFKPFVYALAIMEGWSPCLKVPNVPVTFEIPDQPPWTPRNSDDKYDGKMVTLRFALAHSINYVTAYIMKQFGPDPVVQLARRLGITAPIDAVPSLCLGTAEISLYEMVGAMSTFANQGTRVEPIFITRIEDKHGRVLSDFRPRTEEVMDEEKAYVMLQLLKGVTRGTGARLRYRYKLNQPMGGKTGTTQNNSDGWFMGVTPDLVSGCWVGGEDRSIHFASTNEGQGAAMALPIFAYYMQKVYANKKINLYQGEFEKPSGNITVELDCDKYDSQTEAGSGGGDDGEDDF